MTICLKKSYSFGLLYVYFMNIYPFVCLLLSFLVLRVLMWDLMVLVPDHCLSVCFTCGVCSQQICVECHFCFQ